MDAPELSEIKNCHRRSVKLSESFPRNDFAVARISLADSPYSIMLLIVDASISSENPMRDLIYFSIHLATLFIFKFSVLILMCRISDISSFYA